MFTQERSDEQKVDPVEGGVNNALVNCLGLSANDKLFIVTDEITWRIGEQFLKTGLGLLNDEIENCRLVKLDDFGQRPFLSLPERFEVVIREFRPTATIYTASCLPGEFKFRKPLIDLLMELEVRHAHMPDINKRLMTEGMQADYREIQELTAKVIEKMKGARKVVVTAPNGTNLTINLDPKLKWLADDGNLREQGKWGNLPAGEAYTSPASVEGMLFANVLGDFFGQKYGPLWKEPVGLRIENGRVSEVIHPNQILIGELRDYLAQDENASRIGEFGIGTNIGLKTLCGVLLQDEKYPGIHLAAGSPYPEETGATWDSKTHLDLIPVECTIMITGEAGKEIIMSEGRFTL